MPLSKPSRTFTVNVTMTITEKSADYQRAITGQSTFTTSKEIEVTSLTQIAALMERVDNITEPIR